MSNHLSMHSCVYLLYSRFLFWLRRFFLLLFAACCSSLSNNKSTSWICSHFSLLPQNPHFYKRNMIVMIQIYILIVWCESSGKHCEVFYHILYQQFILIWSHKIQLHYTYNIIRAQIKWSSMMPPMHFIANHFSPFLTVARICKLYINKVIPPCIRPTIIVSLTKYQ